MNYPVVPLIKALSGLSSINVGYSEIVTFVAGIFGLALLIKNAYEPRSYDEGLARWGFLLLGVAIFVSVVGMAYILTFAVAALLLYLLMYWILWRFLIANVIAAIWPNAHVLHKSKSKDKKKAKAKTTHGSGEGSS
jgi:predicted membrane protein